MNRHPSINRPRQRGFSLIEVLVAVAIFAMIFIAALLMYDRGAGVFQRGVNAADAQQNTRVGFDKIVADLRMAGFDYDRDGFPSGSIGTTWATGIAYGVGVFVVPTTWNGFYYRATTAGTSGGSQPIWPTTQGATVGDNGITWEAFAASGSFQQPDEQIEHAGPTAITIRGNFDYESNAAQDQGREGALAQAAGDPNYESTQFPVITTGNDEIVTYALVSDSAPMGTAPNNQSVTFFADVNNGGAPSRTAYPGGNSERLITIAGVDLTNNNPPYTLHRFTLNNAGGVVSSPLASNIRSLNFLYYQDQQGVAPLRDTSAVARPGGETILGTGQYNPNSPSVSVAGRAGRSRIRSVRVLLVSMTAQRDSSFTDEAEVLASARNFRKFRLESLVVPRNIGKRGLREQNTDPPGAPVLNKLWLGHCCLAHVQWTPPVTGGGVEGYAVLYDTDLVGGFANVFSVGVSTEAYVPFTPAQTGTTYYFAVQATSSFGNGPISNNLSGLTKNATKPDPPAGLTATPGINVIDLTWTRPALNELGSLTGVPSGVVNPQVPLPGQETLRYRVYRDDAIGFAASGTTNTLWNETSSGGGAPAENLTTGVVSFTDNQAANCVNYYYRVAAIDLCGETGSPYNLSGATGLSEIEPLNVSPAILGNNPGNGIAPATPGAPTLGILSSCSLGNCTIILRWPEVTQDTDTPTANPLVVDRYDIIVRKKLTGTIVGFATGSPFTVTGYSAIGMGPTLQRTLNLPEPDNTTWDTYEFTVVAYNCSDASAESPPVAFPCVFNGSLSPSWAIPAAIDGSGTAGSPFLVYGAGTLNISGLGASVVSVSVTVFGPGPTEIIPATPYPVAGGVATGITLTDPTDDGSTYWASVTATDSGGCTRTFLPVYFQGTSTNCCLVRVGLLDGTGAALSVGDNSLRVTFTNQCSGVVTMPTTNGLRFNWRGSNFANGKKLDAINWNGTAGTVANFNDSILVAHDRPVAAQATIASGANYYINFTFSKTISNLIEANAPVKDFCITYTTPTAAVCKIYDDGAAPNCP